jgi:hypothetical protein
MEVQAAAEAASFPARYDSCLRHFGNCWLFCQVMTHACAAAEATALAQELTLACIAAEVVVLHTHMGQSMHAAVPGKH